MSVGKCHHCSLTSVSAGRQTVNAHHSQHGLLLLLLLSLLLLLIQSQQGRHSPWISAWFQIKAMEQQWAQKSRVPLTVTVTLQALGQGLALSSPDAVALGRGGSAPVPHHR